MKFSLKNICQKIAAASAAMTRGSMSFPRGSMSFPRATRESFAKTIAALFCLAALLFTSCEGLGSDVQNFAPQNFEVAESGTAYITLGAVRAIDGGIARTVVPEAASSESFSDLKLYLVNPTSGEETELASAATLAELSSQLIEVSVGEKTFRLVAKRGGVNFSGDTTATLAKGSKTELSFSLNAEAGAKGGLSVTINFEGQAACASYILFSDTDTVAHGDATFSKTAAGGSADVNLSGLDTDTYSLEVYFFGDEAKTIRLNTYRELVRVSAGLTSRAERSIDLTALYKITYHNMPSGVVIEGGGTLPLNYSRKSGTITLPSVKTSGKYFVGYYTAANFNKDSKISQILGTSGRDVDLYPLFTDKLYVKNGGATDAAGTPDDPFGSVAAAVAKIIDIADDSIDWNLMIDGVLDGPQKIVESAGAAGIEAASITLKGVNGPSGGAFQDGIDAGWDGTSVPTSEIGPALTINTTVPITIHDLYVKGGYTTNGGGICLNQGYVSFESGLITTNKATKYGGGVYLAKGGCTLVMQGGSISDNSASDRGGAVYITSLGAYGAGSFIMSGGAITGNSDGYGNNAVYVPAGDSNKSWAGNFEMSGSAVVSNDNYVYLAAGSDEAVITVSGALTGEGVVATITGEEDASGVYKNIKVLKAEGSGSVIMSYKKFAVNPDSAGNSWYVGTDGRLTTTQPQSFELYVQQGASGSGTSASSPFGSIEEAANYIAANGNSGTVASIKIIGNLSGAQVLSGFNDSKAKQIVIEGANGVDATSGTPLDALTGGSGVEKTLTVNLEDVSVEIKNLRISGATQTGLYVGDSNGAYSNVLLSEGTLITQNGTGSGDYNGGGVYITASSFVDTSDGCLITNNKAGANGGGVYCQGRLFLFGGTISNNQAVKGTGIYVDSNGTLGMMGNGSVSSGNDIYLVNPDVSTYGGIAILGTLTAQSPVATITPHVYENGTQLLESYNVLGPAPDIAEESQKFALTQPSGSAVTWSINTNGMLSDGSTTVSFYVAQNGSSSAAGSRGDPFDSLSDALDYIADNDYSGYDVIVKVDGLLPVSDHEVQHTVYISSFSGNSLTIEGANGLENGIPQDSISGDLQIYFDNYVLSKITFRNICLTGSSSGNYIGSGDGEIGYYRTNVIFDSGVLIKGNTAESSDQGAAFSINDYSSVTMKDGCEISGNYNTGYGSDGVYIDSYGTFNMEGGTIKDNKKSGNTSGTGVKVRGTFNISGGAVVASNNIVSLYSQYTNVTIADDLTADGIVATIGPATSGETGMYVTPAVLLSEAKSGLISAYHNKFAVLPKSGMNWAVDDEGNLVPAGSGGGGTSGTVTADIYVNRNGTGTGASVDSPVGSIAAAVTIIKNNPDSTKDWVIGIDGTLEGCQVLEDVASTEAKSITLTGINGYDAASESPRDWLDGDSGWDVSKIYTDDEGVPSSLLDNAVLDLVNNTVPVTITNLGISGGYSDQGGGIYVGGGTLTLGENAFVAGNLSRGHGGGIFVYSGDVILDGGTITHNKSRYSSNGGGVYMQGGTFTLKSGTISNNWTDYGSGAGVYVEGAVFNMVGGSIENNTTVYNSSGGVCVVGNGAEFNMTGGSISGNKAYSGEYSESATYIARGVYYNTNFGSVPTITIGGGAVIASDNDVFLMYDTKNSKLPQIKITSDLTGYSSGQKIMITPERYINNMPVLSDDSGGTLVGQCYNKFSVTPDSSTSPATNWYVGYDGTITNATP